MRTFRLVKNLCAIMPGKLGKNGSFLQLSYKSNRSHFQRVYRRYKSTWDVRRTLQKLVDHSPPVLDLEAFLVYDWKSATSPQRCIHAEIGTLSSLVCYLIVMAVRKRRKTAKFNSFSCRLCDGNWKVDGIYVHELCCKTLLFFVCYFFDSMVILRYMLQSAMVTWMCAKSS